MNANEKDAVNEYLEVLLDVFSDKEHYSVILTGHSLIVKGTLADMDDPAVRITVKPLEEK